MTTGFKGRAVITTVGSTDPVFDFRNDGFNGSIDYGFDYVQNPQPAQRTGPSTIPSIKINGSCWGDVELAKGGGFVSTGTHFEVGSPVSSYLIASNILANSRIGQRVTLNTNIPDATILTSPQLTNYNTQLFVNKNLTRALSVFNTATNAIGDEVFTVYGDGKTQIKANVKANKYFTITDISNTSSPIESFVVYGDGKTEITTTSTDAFTIKNNFTNDINFKVKTNGLVYAREINVATGAFPDYVFAKNYNLKPILEVEKFIQKNNHLEGFEKAKYYESNGMSIGEIVKLQQEKIEELTLYLIELKKEINEIKNINK